MEQQQPTTAHPRPSARRVPGLEGITGKLRVEVPSSPPRLYAVHDGIVEEVRGEKSEGQADATLQFDDEASVKNLFSGKLNPLVAGLQGHLRVVGDLGFVARVLFELQGQANAFGKSIMGEA